MLPKPFPIPTFRLGTEKNFQNKILTDTDRKYVVQTLSTVLMTYAQKISLFHCSTVAKALIAKHAFLKDAEGDGEVRYNQFSISAIVMFSKFFVAFLEVVYIQSLQ